MIFAHTDYYKYYIHIFKNNHKINHNKCLNLMLSELQKISKKKLIIPTYNYDFGHKNIFCKEKDKSQVGSFSEFIRKKYSKNRNNVPMFSTTSTFKRNISDKNKEIIDPFNNNSDFGNLLNKKGKIIFFGSEFAPTFIIYIEKNFPGGVPYRFNKIFKGYLKNKNRKVSCSLVHYVRPKKIKILYDLNKIKNELIKKKILIKKITKSGFNYEEIQTNKFYNWGIKKLNKNIFYFLTPLSRREFKQKT